MAMAPAAYVLFAKVMRHNPRDPDWPDRDRFVLSAGHGSMLLYSALHLSGYDLPMERAQALSPVGLADAGPSRARPRARHARRRGHHRPAGPGLCQRRRHGARRALPARDTTASEVMDHFTLRDRLRRRPDGGHRLRGRFAGRPARARPPGLPLRRQLDLARRPDVAELRLRGRHQALRGLRLARARGPRRQRPRRASRPRSSEGKRHDRAADADPRQVDHRLPVARPSRARSKAHGAPLGEDEVRATKEVARLGPRPHLPRARRRLRGVRRRERGAAPRPSGRSASTRCAQATPTARASGTWPGRAAPTAASRCPAWPRRCRTSTGARTSSPPAWPARRCMAAFAAVRADDGRRRGRPERVDQDRVPRRRRRALHQGVGRTQRLLGRARARHGRRGQRPGRARRHRAALRLDLPAVRRLHARLDPPQRAHRPARRLGLHARLGRASARTAPPISRSSTSRRCARSRA